MESYGQNGDTKKHYKNDSSMYTRIEMESKIRRGGIKRIQRKDKIKTGEMPYRQHFQYITERPWME